MPQNPNCPHGNYLHVCDAINPWDRIDELDAALAAAEQERDAAYAELRKQADRILALEHMIENPSTE
jgi:hypothetical protein